jgi:Fe2+ transport system protein FeoA
VTRISEQIQPDADMMRRLTDLGLLPGRRVGLVQPDGTGGTVRVVADAGAADVDRRLSDHVFVLTE